MKFKNKLFEFLPQQVNFVLQEIVVIVGMMLLMI